MRHWADRLAGMRRVGSLLGVGLVTPIAHLANRSLPFQTYLYAIFHRTAVARVGHAILMPAILVAAFASLASLSVPLAVTAAVLLACWYGWLALAHRLPLLAVVMVPLTAALCALGILWVTPAPSVVPGAPWLWVVLLGLVQTLTHAAEPDVPPRVNGTNHWMSQRAFFARAPIRNGVRAVLMVVAGTANELWASWRLLPVLVLDALWRVGCYPNERAQMRDWVHQAVADGDPAIDFIGQGGACVGAYP